MTFEIPYDMFDAGHGLDFDQVHLSVWTTPSGTFITDGCALIHQDWCDDQVRNRTEHTEPKEIDPDWWRAVAMTRWPNGLSETVAPVHIRPYYELTLKDQADLTYRSATQPARIIRDHNNSLRGLIAATTTPHPTHLIETRLDAIHHMQQVINAAAPTIHPHELAAAALAAVEAKSVQHCQQTHLGFEVAA